MKKIVKYLFRILLFLFIFINIAAAFYAYKFTHFYDPENEVVKKYDAKTSWEKIKDALTGRHSIKLKNTVIPDSTFQTEYLTTKDNLKLEGWYIKTDSIAKGTVLLFHGHGGNKSGVINEAQEFLKMGYNTFLLDFRAHGSSEGNICTLGYYESEDVKLAYDYIKNKGEKNIVLWGISMGAATIIKTINDSSIRPSKIILEMPFGSLLQAAEGRTKIMGLPPEPIATLITFWGGTEQGFWAFGMKPSEYAKKINCPVLLQWGKNDPRVSRAEIDAIYNNISDSKKLVVYDSCAHESLCNRENEKWINEVKNFLLQ
jgi:alpha-beta hydrolase superfamily lysophospholipase